MRNNFFKYCPGCGKELRMPKTERLIECSFCGFLYYWNAAPTVAVILENRKGEILLVERKLDPYKGFFDLPGGFVDLHENYEAALIREIKEELGVTAGELFYIGSSTDIYPFKGITYNTITAVYKGIIDQKVYPADDVASFKFIDKKDYQKERFAFPNLSLLVEKYISKNI